MKTLFTSILLFASLLLQAQTATIFASGFTNLEGIEIAPNNFNNGFSVLVSERESKKIFRINEDGNVSSTSDLSNDDFLNDIHDIAWMEFYDDTYDEYNNIRAITAENIVIFLDDIENTEFRELEPETKLYGACTKVNGNEFYFSDENLGKIIIYSFFTGAFEDYIDGFVTPKDLALDSNLNLYVADRGSKELVKITPNKEKIIIASNIENINGVGVSPLDDVYFTSYNEVLGEDKILKYEASTGIVSDFATTNLDKPNRIAIAENGEIYVTNKGNDTVVKIIDESLSTNSFNLNGNFSLYPSITNGIVTVSNQKNISPISISIYNVNGALIKNVAQSGNRLDFGTASSGVYFVKIDASKGSTTKKVIKI